MRARALSRRVTEFKEASYFPVQHLLNLLESTIPEADRKLAGISLSEQNPDIANMAESIVLYLFPSPKR